VMSAATGDAVLSDYGRLPLVFEPNEGQADPEIKFLARGRGSTLFLTKREAVLGQVRMRLVGASKQAIQALDPTGGISNYFIGNDRTKWRTHIPHYRRVAYKGVYPGVDLVYYGNPQNLEYDFVVAPGADAAAIQVEYAGADSLRVDGDGDLVLKTATGELRQKRPRAYQETARGRVAVDVSYRLKGRRVAFELARYDARRRLVIDPILLYSTYLGNSAGDRANSVAIDGAGNAYVTGLTPSMNFPTVNALQGANAGGNDMFVTKINAAGSARVYSTYLGGTGQDVGNGIAVDSVGNAYVSGSTSSFNFPTMNPLQAANGGGNLDAAIVKLNANGSALIYATYLGGNAEDFGTSIAVDVGGNAYVAGETTSPNFPTTNPLQPAFGGGGSDAFVAKITANGSSRVYSTYLGGSTANVLGTRDEIAYGIAVDSAGAVYLTGSTSSTNFPTMNALQPTHGGGGNDVFVTKINTAGSALVYSTFLGGSGSEEGSAIALDASGASYVTGYTLSTNFPTTNPLQPTNLGGNGDTFLTKINPAGSARVYSTYLGGTGEDRSFAVAVDAGGNAYVSGYTVSTDFPSANPLQVANAGSSDVFVAKINANCTAINYSTYFGDVGGEGGAGIAVDAGGGVLVTGSTTSASFPTANPLPSAVAGTFLLSISGISPTGVFRDVGGAVWLTSELSTLLSTSGGAFASDPSAAQNEKGDTFVVARDSSNAVWLNVFDSKTRTWDGWMPAGAAVVGVPAVAAIGNVAYIVARDAFNAYWTNSFTRGVGFSGWVSRGGVFSTDPVIGKSPLACCNLYIVGKDNFSAIWSANWVFPTFGVWQLQGAVVNGKPSVTGGADGAAYIVIRDPSNSLWMGRQNGAVFNGWQPGGGVFISDPQVAAASGKVYAAALGSGGAVWSNTFTEGMGNNWVGWVNTAGTLSSVAAAAGTGPQLFLTGRDGANQLWWYENPGIGWKFAGGAGLAAGSLLAAPR